MNSCSVVERPFRKPNWWSLNSYPPHRGQCNLVILKVQKRYISIIVAFYLVSFFVLWLPHYKYPVLVPQPILIDTIWILLSVDIPSVIYELCWDIIDSRRFPIFQAKYCHFNFFKTNILYVRLHLYIIV